MWRIVLLDVEGHEGAHAVDRINGVDRQTALGVLACSRHPPDSSRVSPMSIRPRSRFLPFSRHPLIAAIPLAYFIYRIATAGLSTMRTIGLVTVGLWFAVALLEWLRGRRTSP